MGLSKMGYGLVWQVWAREIAIKYSSGEKTTKIYKDDVYVYNHTIIEIWATMSYLIRKKTMKKGVN